MSFPEWSEASLSVSRAFRYEPRRLVTQPKQFGKTRLDLEPAAGVDPADPRFVAAQLHHHVANAAREAILARGHSLDSYTTKLQAPGMTYDRLVRMQRGETLMQLADLMNWTQHFENVRTLLNEYWTDQRFSTSTIKSSLEADPR